MSENSGTDPAGQQGPSKSPAATKQEKTVTQGTPLALAERLLAAGIPVVVCTPCPGYGKPGGCKWRGHEKGSVELHQPKGWPRLKAEDCDLSGFRPGVDTLAMVGGHGLDLVDVDTKVGGSVGHLPPFKSYGETRTPSGGGHYVVPSSGFGKVSGWKTELGHVGDYVGGKPDGSGRQLGYLPGSTRPKYAGRPYTEEVQWDVEACLAAGPDPSLVEALEAAGGSREARSAEYVDDSPRRPVEDGVHPYAAAAIKAELARLDACDLLGLENWDTTAHAVACNLIEFANSNWTGYTLEQAEADFLAHAPTDEGFGPAKHDEKWESALNNVGNGGRRCPDFEPADDFEVELVSRRSDGEDWLVNMVLPARSYGVLDGPIGAGKSSILGHIVHRVTGKGFRVRYCVEDEPMSTARHRLELLGTDMSLVELDEVPDLTTPEAMARYAASCRSAGVDLVLFDLLASANSAYEENRPEKVKNWTKQLVEQFCTRHGMSVLGTHHWNNNSKAGSALARQSGGGALSAKAEFHWSVAMSNDRSEQVWTVHARRKIPIQQNRWMKGTPHFIEELEDEYEPGEKQQLNVYTVSYEANAGDRTAKDVADEAAREYAEGRKRPSSRDVVAEQADVLLRFLGQQPRKRPEVDGLLYLLSGVEYGPQTVVDRLRDVGAIQCTDKGEPMERGKFWTVER